MNPTKYKFVIDSCTKSENYKPKFQLDYSDYEKNGKKDNYLLSVVNDNVIITHNGEVKYEGKRANYRPDQFGLFDDKLKPVLNFDLNCFAGGRLVIYNNDLVELTINGSGIPIIFSCLGKLEKV
jgi:hypothetical protein